MITEKRARKIKNWVGNHGAEVMPNLAEWEFFRAKTNQGLFIIYRNKRNQYKPNDAELLRKITCWMKDCRNLNLGIITQRKKLTGVRKALFKRDGNQCFYCGEGMRRDQMTIEHLLSLSHGGSNRIENLVLSHSICNANAGSLSLLQKIELREKMRGYENE